MTHCAFGASTDGQAFVWAKSGPMLNELIVIGPSPAFRSVTVWAGLVDPTPCCAKLSADGLKAAFGSVPVPRRGIACTLPGASSVMASAPPRAPEPVGAKATSITQLDKLVTLEPQLLLCLKSPLAMMPLMLTLRGPLLIRVTCSARLVVPTFRAENISAGGFMSMG